MAVRSGSSGPLRRTPRSGSPGVSPAQALQSVSPMLNAQQETSVSPFRQCSDGQDGNDASTEISKKVKQSPPLFKGNNPELEPTSIDLSCAAATPASLSESTTLQRVRFRAARWESKVDAMQQQCMKAAFAPSQTASKLGRAASRGNAIVFGIVSRLSNTLWWAFAYTAEVTQPLRDEVAQDTAQCLRGADDLVAQGKCEHLFRKTQIFLLEQFEQALDITHRVKSTVFAPVFVLLAFCRSVVSKAVALTCAAVSLWVGAIAQSMGVAKKVSVYTAAVITDPVTLTASLATICTGVCTTIAQNWWKVLVSSADAAAHASVKTALCTYRITRSIVKTGVGLGQTLVHHSGFFQPSDSVSLEKTSSTGSTSPIKNGQH